jgi:quercetin dioxygenase-like cupin family protein
MTRRTFAALLLTGWVATALGQAPAPAAPTTGFSSRPMLVSPISGVDGKELVLSAVTLEPGASSPPHTHPGDCYGSVIEGAIELRVAGQAARRVAAGEAYANAQPGVPHQFTNVGSTTVRMVNTLVVEKGKPRLVTLPDPVK